MVPSEGTYTYTRIGVCVCVCARARVCGPNLKCANVSDYNGVLAEVEILQSVGLLCILLSSLGVL